MKFIAWTMPIFVAISSPVFAATLDGSAPVFSIRTANVDNPLFGGTPNTQVGNGTATTDDFSTDTEVGSLRGDIRSGELGMALGAVSPISGLPLTEYSARFFDFISLGNDVGGLIGQNFDVTFQIALDGQHLLEGDSNRRGLAITSSRFSLYDVSGLAVPLIDDSATGGFVRASDDATLIDSFGFLQESTLNRSGTNSPDPRDPITHLPDVALDGQGQRTTVDETISQTFSLQAGRTYLAQYGIASTLFLDGGSADRLSLTNGVVDFLNTSQLSITDLGGAQINSASGAFLADATAPLAPVPVPASLPLLLFGVLGLGFLRRRQTV